MFTLSKDYLRLWELLHSGATVVYRVSQDEFFDEAGIIRGHDCPHIVMNFRVTDEDGLKEWRGISLSRFVSECERLNLQFFDELTTSGGGGGVIGITNLTPATTELLSPNLEQRCQMCNK